MDKEEVSKIKKAIRFIHHEEKHYEGLNILAKLVGWPEVDPVTGSHEGQIHCGYCGSRSHTGHNCPHRYTLMLDNE